MPTYPHDASIVVDHVSKDFKLRHHRTMKEVTGTREMLATFQLTPRKQPTA